MNTKIKNDHPVRTPDSEQNESKWHKVSQIMDKIDSLASTSPCPKLKVAYVLIDLLYNILVYATNGYEENGEPCSKTGEDHHCVHAEISLIRKIRDRRLSVDNCIFVGNYNPCPNCMNEIVNLGIKEVVFKEYFHDLNGLLIAKKNGVKSTLFSEFRLVELTEELLECMFLMREQSMRDK